MPYSPFGGGSSSHFDPRKKFELYDDFVATSNAGNTGWTATVSGSGAAVSTNSTSAASVAGRPGIVNLSTGTTTTGHANLGRGNNLGSGFLIGGGPIKYEAAIYLADLSAVGEEFIIRIGLGDTTGADQVDGVYFIYDRLTSVNWIMGTAANSVRTATASSTAVAEDAWLRLTIEVNSAGSSATYYVNGTSIGSVSTNLPSGAARHTGQMCGIIKSAGSTARSYDLDYVYTRQDFSTLR